MNCPDLDHRKRLFVELPPSREVRCAGIAVGKTAAWPRRDLRRRHCFPITAL